MINIHRMQVTQSAPVSAEKLLLRVAVSTTFERVAPRALGTCYGQPGDRSPGCCSRTVRASFPAHGSSSCWPWSSASRLSGTRQISFRGIALQCAEGTCLSDAPATGRPASKAGRSHVGLSEALPSAFASWEILRL